MNVLRFADIVIGNADDSSIAPIPAKAMVTEAPGLRLPAVLISQLQMSPVVMPQSTLHDDVATMGLAMLPGLATLRCNGHEITAGADACESGIWLGADLAAKLQITVKPFQEKQGEASHILLQENSIPADTIGQLCAHARSQELEPIGKEYRTTLMAPLKGIEPLIHRTLHDLTVRYIEPFYNLEIESWEPPQFLVYKEGGVYSAHADGSHWVRDEKGENGHWERCLDRDISFLLYLNDEFTGGKLDFPDLDFKITPRPGLLATFPSSHSYRHGAERTLSGERLVLVTWMRAVGTPREWPKPIRRFMKKDYA